ncbi:RNA polymerase sigma factor [Tepidiforma sp.]|uniref:RNA polymerase sigma factor n=1 Tax=Tepidiforma sp. TaxID=2682230 RepID=UPI002ADE301F|nr:sigma-70 family RNA polymerase sigma factor [Tepidiforma sp.]
MRIPEGEAHALPATPQPPDAELAHRAARRDPAAWETIFETHYRAIYAYLRYRLGDPAEAEDIASQVFETAYARAHTFDYRGAPIHAWLHGIARNLARDVIKRRIRRGPPAALEDAPEPVTDDTAAISGLRHDLAVALATLTEDQQEVLYHRFIHDRSLEETARLMNRSEDAVKHLQRRALAAMQRALGQGAYTGGSP